MWLCWRSARTPPLLAGACRMWPRCCLAPIPVPCIVAGCAHCPCWRHPVVVVAWHLSVCLGCGRQRASLACLVAPRWCAAPRPVWSLLVLRLALPTLQCLSPLRGISPPDLLGGCAGHVEAGREPGSLCLPVAAAKAAAVGSLRVVPVPGPAMGLSLACPLGVGLGLRAPRWFVCADPGSDASDFPYVRLVTGDSAGAQGLFRVDTDTVLFASEDATPGPGECVHVCAPLGRVGRGDLLGPFWCPSPFPVAGLGTLLVPSRLGLPCFCLFLRFFAPLLSLALRVFRPWVPWASASCATPHLSLFFSYPVPLARFFFCLFLFFPCLGSFFFPSFLRAFFFSAAVCCLFGARLLCVSWAVGRVGVCCCGRCPSAGCQFALALCHLVLPACACSVCVVACCVARVGWRPAGGVSLPCAASAALLVWFVRWSCSAAALASSGCPGVLWWGCPVAPGLIVLFCLALVYVLVVSFVWRFAPFCQPAPLVVCAVFFLLVGCVLAVPPSPPSRLVVVPCVVWCCGLCCLLCCTRCCVACLFWVGLLRHVVRRGVVLGLVVLFLLCFAVVRCCFLCWFFFALFLAFARCSGLFRRRGALPWCVLVFGAAHGVFCRCLLCFGVCCWAWLSSGVTWWVLVASGVVFRWCAAVCPWVLCCAVLLRVVPPGVALLCAVLFCFALFGAVAQGLVPWVAVRRPGVLCLPDCILSCLPALCVFCRGALLLPVVRGCALCRVRPWVSCCAFPVLSAL